MYIIYIYTHKSNIYIEFVQACDKPWYARRICMGHSASEYAIWGTQPAVDELQKRVILLKSLEQIDLLPYLDSSQLGSG